MASLIKEKILKKAITIKHLFRDNLHKATIAQAKFVTGLSNRIISIHQNEVKKNPDLSLLVTTQLKVLASFDGQLFSIFTLCAFHSQHYLPGCLGLIGRI